MRLAIHRTLSRLATLAVVALAFTAYTPAHAGRPCEAPTLPKKETIENGLKLAQRTLDTLNRSGADVVLLARAGQDLSKYGLRYSHLGLAYRQTDSQGTTVWRILHKLNECGSAESALYRQGLGDFFLDNMWRYEASVIVPKPDIQAQLLSVITNDALFAQLHHKPYSIVSYAWGQKYQQSNQWAIETMAMSMDADANKATYSRTQAQAWLKAKGYQPTPLNIGPLTRLGARIGSANVAFDDHPDDKRYSDRIETVTVDSVIAWMTRTGYAERIITIPQSISSSATLPPDRVQQIASNKDLQAANDAFRNKDYARAYTLLLPLAQAGDKEAQFTMGLLLRNGYGRTKDTAEAIRWFRLSAAQTYSPAEYNLGTLYSAEPSVPKDYNEAIFWLNRASGHGNLGAKALLDQVTAQKRLEDQKAASAQPSPVPDSAAGNRIVVRPNLQDEVAPCVRASRVQCTPAETDAWTRDFLKSLQQSVRYPQSAVLNSRAGEVSLNLTICEGDTTPRASVRVSSGFSDLDAAALQAARSLRVQAPICSGLSAPIALTAPVTFSLDEGSKATSR